VKGGDIRMLQILHDIIAENVEDILGDGRDEGSIQSYSVKAEDLGRVLVDINNHSFTITIEEN